MKKVFKVAVIGCGWAGKNVIPDFSGNAEPKFAGL